MIFDAFAAKKEEEKLERDENVFCILNFVVHTREWLGTFFSSIRMNSSSHSSIPMSTFLWYIQNNIPDFGKTHFHLMFEHLWKCLFLRITGLDETFLLIKNWRTSMTNAKWRISTWPLVPTYSSIKIVFSDGYWNLSVNLVATYNWNDRKRSDVYRGLPVQ